MDVTATAYYLRISPRKMLLLSKGIRNMKAKTAVVQLAHINKSGSEQLRSLIASALANAKQKNIDTENLGFKSIEVLPGSAMKRFHAVSRGMAHGYKKRMTHVRVTLVAKPIKDKKTVVQSKAQVANVEKAVDAAPKEEVESTKK